MKKNNDNIFEIVIIGIVKLIKFIMISVGALVLPIILLLKNFFSRFDRGTLSIFIGSLMFVILLAHLANLQIFGFQSIRNRALGISEPYKEITLAKRGQIFIQDSASNQNRIALTRSDILSNFVLDPKELSGVMEARNVSKTEIARLLSSNLNISYQSTLTSINNMDINSRYFVLEKFVTDSQAQTAKLLIEEDPDRLSYFAWLSVQEVLQRSYPYDDLLGSTIGYVPIFKVSKEEALETSCSEAVRLNEENRTGLNEYSIGYYGLEQKYCSELAGVNGKNLYKGSQAIEAENVSPLDGVNLQLTLDLTLQRKADEILKDYVEENTNENGSPENASIIVMESKTGKILALSSYPNFDPNRYSSYSTENYRNIATSLDYEVGSTLKPLTVALALSENEKGTTDDNGNVIGVSPNFFKPDYGQGGKIYTDAAGTQLPIRNSQNISYAGDPTCCDLKRTIRDSLNTMISDIVDSVGSEVLEDYFKDKFLFDKPTTVAFGGGGFGNLSTLEQQRDCLFCFSQHGFGQGLYISPVQLMRAFSAIANDGYLVEPYIVESIENSDGTIDNGEKKDSLIQRPDPYPILTKQSANLVASYMQAVVDEGYLGQSQFKNSIPGYSVAAKTGTAQITRADDDGNSCNYSCNTQKGLFDHSLIGFAPVSDPEIMVMVKIAEPNPGEKTNFSDATSMPSFKKMMQFALEYKNVPKDR